MAAISRFQSTSLSTSCSSPSALRASIYSRRLLMCFMVVLSLIFLRANGGGCRSAIRFFAPALKIAVDIKQVEHSADGVLHHVVERPGTRIERGNRRGDDSPALGKREHIPDVDRR